LWAGCPSVTKAQHIISIKEKWCVGLTRISYHCFVTSELTLMVTVNDELLLMLLVLGADGEV